MQSFRTGIGKTYESDGPATVTKSEERHRITAETVVVPKMIPALESVAAKLENGALVADVGCGDGALTIALARRIRARFFTRWIRAGLRSSTSSGGPPRTD